MSYFLTHDIHSPEQPPPSPTPRFVRDDAVQEPSDAPADDGPAPCELQQRPEPTQRRTRSFALSGSDDLPRLRRVQQPHSELNKTVPLPFR
jgi:hypothetical protein